ncbi:hypothetical protein HETIRDRAFT_420703 [Heterobasidion irregulare TC 32-1]|uniref:Uncharacterized protein n=1 Tax=Heterobasidion irregulare (strain TC 32-1) TaxID=747525 RepID=W4JWE3_HETIT|nr:uncharacterized protein HETIRDRAFT_420703 [Heterobasidion irregulare TC 32-1]ETW77883.1 hypothetical protein HETIRDRAFT_420703 [Heterobasidion irregulare TC 32-1]
METKRPHLTHRGIGDQTTLWTYTMARIFHHRHMRINASPSNKTWLCDMPPLSPAHETRHLHTVSVLVDEDEDCEYGTTTLLSYYPALCTDGETHIQVGGSCRCPPVLFHGPLEHLSPCVGITSTRARGDLRSFPFPAVPIWRSGRLPSLMDMRRWSDWVGA